MILSYPCPNTTRVRIIALYTARHAHATSTRSCGYCCTDINMQQTTCSAIIKFLLQQHYISLLLNSIIFVPYISWIAPARQQSASNKLWSSFCALHQSLPSPRVSIRMVRDSRCQARPEISYAIARNQCVCVCVCVCVYVQYSSIDLWLIFAYTVT